MCTFFLEFIMNKYYMNLAYKEALKAYKKNEVPVGAIIVKNNIVIAKAYNKKVSSGNVMNHAEIIALNKAAKKLGDWRLNDCIMYVTLEPCPMCASAITQSRIKKVFVGTESNIKSNKKIVEMIFNNKDYYHQVEFEYLNDKDSSNILSLFFSNKR